MEYPHMDPCDLPLVPPMDHNASMSGIDKISPLPMRINTENGVGFFGSRRRDEGSPFIRFHAGVDLLAPVNTPVHPVMGGEVVWSKRGSVHLLHDNGVRYLTVYNHLNEIEPNVQVGQFVGTSNPLGKVVTRRDHPHTSTLKFVIFFGRRKIRALQLGP